MARSVARWACTFTPRLVCAALVGSMFATAALAEPSLSGPSIAAVSEKVAFHGVGFQPVATVQPRLTDPAGAETLLSPQQVASDGTLTVEVTPATPGPHIVSVVNASGVELIATRFFSR